MLINKFIVILKLLVEVNRIFKQFIPIKNNIKSIKHQINGYLQFSRLENDDLFRMQKSFIFESFVSMFSWF